MSKLSFSWPHAASGTVQLAGSFNDWKPADMAKGGDGVWRIELADVPPGEHQFKFVVDGNWVHDGEQPNVANEMGSFNNVITSPAAAPEPGNDDEATPQHDDGKQEVSASAAVASVPSSSSSTPPPKPQIEVERKFSVPANYKDVLSANGFDLVKEFKETLSDDYFDSADYDLMQADHWLRRRNGDWELKYPVGAPSKDDGETTLYHETSIPEDIQATLNSVRKGVGEHWKQGQLTCYAHLETERWCYRKDEVTVVVDVTDWGYRVGEVEVVVTSKDEVAAAVKRIEKIARELNFATLNFAKSFSHLLEE